MTHLATLIAATAVLVAIPGPNVALIVANSIRYGFRSGAVTALGTTLGVGLQLLFVVLGLAVAVEAAAETLSWIRWIGVAYLVYLGVETWRQPPDDLNRVEAAPTVFWRGCMLAAVNPKTLLFNAAFIPQFVADGSLSQFALVAAVFLAVLLIGDVLWAGCASSARRVLGRFAAARNKVTGTFFVVAGIGLAAANRN